MGVKILYHIHEFFFKIHVIIKIVCVKLFSYTSHFVFVFILKYWRIRFIPYDDQHLAM
jgi:hypothetical protein